MNVRLVMFSQQGSNQKNYGPEGTRKRKKNTPYPQNVFLNICFSCAAVWPDSSTED